MRAGKVREAFQHAYRGYQQYAAAHDELLPVTNGAANKYVRGLRARLDVEKRQMLMVVIN